MENEIDSLAGLCHCCGIAQIALDELDAVAKGREIFPPAGFKVVQAADHVALGTRVSTSSSVSEDPMKPAQPVTK